MAAGRAVGGGKPRKPGKARTGGSGGQKKDKLTGRGPTPPAELRPGHPAARRAAAAAKRAGSGRAAGPAGSATGAGTAAAPARGAAPRGAGPGPARRGRATFGLDEQVAGRNPVVEALRAGVPAKALVVASGLDRDDRVAEALKLAERAGVPVREATKNDLDRLTGRAVHQGLALVVPPYDYTHPDDLLRRAIEAPEPPLLVALDGVTDPHNLGAVIRSAAAFGGHGVLVPERRAAGLSASAWKASAGAAARLPVAQATNLARALKSWSDAGVAVVGLAATGTVSLDDLELATDPICVVVGSEGKGLSRLVAERCDVLVRIPMAGPTESLNASVAAGVVLAEIARRRRV